MRNAQVLGICFIIIGMLFVADGVSPEPVRWLRVGAGVMFAIAGIIRIVQARRGAPLSPPNA